MATRHRLPQHRQRQGGPHRRRRRRPPHPPHRRDRLVLADDPARLRLLGARAHRPPPLPARAARDPRDRTAARDAEARPGTAEALRAGDRRVLLDRRARARPRARPRDRRDRGRCWCSPPPRRWRPSPACASAARCSASACASGSCPRPCARSARTSGRAAPSARSRQRTTTFTSRPGTTIVFTTCLPSTCASTFGAASASSMSSILVCGRRREQPVADLAVDLADQLEGVRLQERRVGLRPRLLPHALTRQAVVGVRGRVRGEREQQRRGRRQREAHRARLRLAALGRGDLVDELHDRGDRGVEREAPRQVGGHLVDRPVRLAQHPQAVRVGLPARPGRARPGARRPPRRRSATAARGSGACPRRRRRTSPRPGRAGP